MIWRWWRMRKMRLAIQRGDWDHLIYQAAAGEGTTVDDIAETIWRESR